MQVELIIDLSFGSTGKGQFAGFYSSLYQFDAVAAAWGPNAGHTYIKGYNTLIHTMLPIASLYVDKVFIGPGAMINVDSLVAEIKGIWKWNQPQIFIHENASVVTNNHLTEEKEFSRIGSTMKGSGAAVMQKMRRDPLNMNTAGATLCHSPLAGLVASARQYEDEMRGLDRVLVEGAQGYSLSMHHGFYPYVTSRDVTPAQILADVGIPCQFLHTTIGVTRTLPIRVANRWERGKMVGYSGPFYPDQQELTWEEVGQEPELTTVTKLQRRIATFSREQMRRAIWQCRPDKVFLNFANYVSAGELAPIVKVINGVLQEETGGQIAWLGWGPDDIRPFGVEDNK